MKAGKTKIVLAVWLTFLCTSVYCGGGLKALAGIVGAMLPAVLLTYYASKEDEPWK